MAIETGFLVFEKAREEGGGRRGRKRNKTRLSFGRSHMKL